MHPLYRRFRVALRDRDAAALRALVREHPEAHDGWLRTGSPVRLIAAAGPELLRAAFEAGLRPDSGPAWDIFLQHVAAEGDVEAVALCIEFGADVERRNHRGETALGYACSWGHLEVVTLLVQAGAEINAVEHDPEDGYRSTALDSAMSHPAIVDFLRAAGAKRFSELSEE